MWFKTWKRTQNINSWTNAPKIVNNTCTSKTGNMSENLLNKIRWIIRLLYQEKKITKKVYNNVINSIKL